METEETKQKLANAIKDLESKGDTATINTLVSAYKQKYRTPQTTQKLSDSLWSKVASVGKKIIEPAVQAVKGGIEQMGQAQFESTQGKNPIETGLAYGSGLASIITSPVAPIISPIVSPVIEKSADILGNIKGVQKFAETPAGYATSKVAEDIANTANIAGTVMPTALGGGLKANIVTKPSNLALKTVEKISEIPEIFKASQKTLENNILTSYEKGVKPILSSKDTPTKLAKYKTNVVNAGETILANKENLSFIDDMGDVAKGQLPKSLQNFTDAIEQTKKTIFQQYDEMAKNAGEKGLTVKLSPIADELDTVINNQALNLTHPEAVAYAKNLKDRLTTTGEIDALNAQEVIKNYNNSLDAFYKNPNYDNASRVSIDAMIANKFRQELDSGIESISGAGYQALKNKYGSLSSIERDVVKATLRDARKNIKGLVDFSDIFSGSQVVNGILSMNPATIAQGLTAKGIAEFIKFKNNPNRAVQSMFKDLDTIQRNRLKNQPANTINTTIKTGMNGIIQQSQLKSNTAKTLANDITKIEPKGGLYMENITKKIHPEDLATMKDFTDYVAGDYKPSATLAKELESDAQRIAGKYGFNDIATNKSLANQFGQVLENQSETLKKWSKGAGKAFDKANK